MNITFVIHSFYVYELLILTFDQWISVLIFPRSSDFFYFTVFQLCIYLVILVYTRVWKSEGVFIHVFFNGHYSVLFLLSYSMLLFLSIILSLYSVLSFRLILPHQDKQTPLRPNWPLILFELLLFNILKHSYKKIENYTIFVITIYRQKNKCRQISSRK